MENSFFDGYIATQAGYGAFKDLQYQQLLMQTQNSGCYWTTGFEYFGLCAKPVINSGVEGGDSGSPIFYYDATGPTLIGVLWGGSVGITPPWQLATRTSSFLRQIADSVGVTLRN
jgi:hypothetical protein